MEPDSAMERAWQANHAAVGVAKDAVAAARREWRDAEAALGRCPVWHRALDLIRRAPPCVCHGPQVFEAYERFQAAKPLVDEAIVRFKAGVTPEQEAACR